MTTEAFKQYADMTDEEIDAEVAKLVVMFIGLPGVVGAPMIIGAGYFEEIARHMVECGARAPAEPIKDYQPPTDVQGRKAAGTWRYRDEASKPAETAQERIARLAREEHDLYRAALAERRAKGKNLDQRPTARRKGRR